MSRKLALSSALSVALMAAFALFGPQATTRHGAASGGAGQLASVTASLR